MARPQILLCVLLYIAGTLSVKTVDHVTVRRGGTIKIPCLYDNQYKLNSKYWCKGFTGSFCTIIARANETGKWTITDYPDDNVFTVKLNNSSYSDSGHYWCAVEISNYAADDKKRLYITVQEAPDVSVMDSSVSGHEGDGVSVQGFYSSKYQNEPKQWCRIKDKSCYSVGKTYTSHNSSVQITDYWRRSSFTVNMTGLRLTDSGWYFCSVGDLQVPVQLTVQGKNKNTSESDNSSGDVGPSSSIHKNNTNSTDNSDVEKSAEDKTWISLLWIAVPLLLLLMLVLGIWRFIQKHSLSTRGPDICSVSEGITYDTVVFKKTEDHEKKQVSTSCPSEQNEVIYSAVKRH